MRPPHWLDGVIGELREVDDTGRCRVNRRPRAAESISSNGWQKVFFHFRLLPFGHTWWARGRHVCHFSGVVQEMRDIGDVGLWHDSTLPLSDRRSPGSTCPSTRRTACHP